MNAQNKHEVRQRLADEVEELLRHTPEERLRWQGTRADLLEALHTAYIYGRLFDERGELYSFIRLVTHVGSILHMTMPRNPWAMADRARRRKCVKQTPYIERYARQAARTDGGHPFTDLLTTG